MDHRLACSVSLLLLALLSPSAHATDFEVIPVLPGGTPSPDGNGAFERVFLSPTINERSEVGISARLTRYDQRQLRQPRSC